LLFEKTLNSLKQEVLILHFEWSLKGTLNLKIQSLFESCILLLNLSSINSILFRFHRIFKVKNFDFNFLQWIVKSGINDYLVILSLRLTFLTKLILNQFVLWFKVPCKFCSIRLKWNHLLKLLMQDLKIQVQILYLRGPEFKYL